jgi:hypothetical protein
LSIKSGKCGNLSFPDSAYLRLRIAFSRTPIS